MGLLALNRALRVDGCFVCAATADLLAIPTAAEAVCRTCLPKLGALLTCCRDVELCQWFVIDDWQWTDRPLDGYPHADLAIDHEETLSTAAIREAAIALTLGRDGEVASARILGILFHWKRRKVGCLAGVAWAVRRAGE